MSQKRTKEEIIQHKKSAIRKLNALLEGYIASNEPAFFKKTDLLSYWLEQYTKYIQQEHDFDPKRLKSYKRGDIVKLNFGFNVGSEYGGLHYAVVINNDNPHSSPVLTVVPLTSLKTAEDQIHPDDVFLGNEIYKALKIKYDTLEQSLEIEKNNILTHKRDLISIRQFVRDKLDKLSASSSSSPDLNTELNETENYIDIMDKMLDELREELKKNIYDQQQLDKIGSEIAQMKSGSIALVTQITTVSKMRIYDPKNARGVLDGIRLSSVAMEKINNSMKKFFIHE